MKKVEQKKLLKKIIGFSLIGLFFWVITPHAGYAVYATLDFAAVAVFFYKLMAGGKILKKALLLGTFLMVFDWVVENAGAVAGLWRTYGSALPVAAVPVEIMILTLVGGTAWALHLPKKPSREFIVAEALVFGFFGALGEWLLIQNGIMTYSGWWTSLHAFLGYFLTWMVLFFVWLKGIRR